MGPVFRYVIRPPSLCQMPPTNPRSKPSAAGDIKPEDPRLSNPGGGLDPDLKWIPRASRDLVVAVSVGKGVPVGADIVSEGPADMACTNKLGLPCQGMAFFLFFVSLFILGSGFPMWGVMNCGMLLSDSNATLSYCYDSYYARCCNNLQVQSSMSLNPMLQSCTVTHDPAGGVFGPPTLLTTFNSTPNPTLRRPIKEVRHDHE
ncbi:UDP-sulfoquinovose synthase [Corchorus olitorius]|uniref:UDP-sulfoquinovose synthase n=1 Tax=Corchorus olitorius TaxID=93759 RepID=A0A1R3KKC0_9ROSI|nr:UDP-sulfoquinovose synthase [Corchorus olitorius]